jgi:TRAP-type C4-dicarboxylate transport system permease large subunit
MTLTGVRGFIVNNALNLNLAMLYIAIIVILPAFGAVSSYGGASVLGVPFLLALLSGNQIVTAATLSFIASLGDLMPPTALAGNYSAQIVNEKYSEVLKFAAIPFFVCLGFALLCLLTSNKLGFLIF